MHKVLLFLVCACADRLVAVLVVGVVEGQGGRKDFHRQVGWQALIKSSPSHQSKRQGWQARKIKNIARSHLDQ